MPVNYAVVENRIAWLSSAFGRDYACRVFNMSLADLESLVGRYQRGKRKGLLRGYLSWDHVKKGGWFKAEPGYRNGYVIQKNLRFNFTIEIPPSVLKSLT